MTVSQRTKTTAQFGVLLAAILGAVFGPKVAGVNTKDVGTYFAVAVGALLTALHGHRIPVIRHVLPKTPKPPDPPGGGHYVDVNGRWVLIHAIGPDQWRPGPPPKPKVPRFGIDWAWGSISPKALRTIGASFAIRYLSWDPSKNLQPGESKQLHKAGIDRVVVWETTAQRTLDGAEAGAVDARNALTQARACGLPNDGSWAIYFAIDFDATGADVENYFLGVRSVIGHEHAGAYGGIRPLAHLLARGIITYAWQTYAWSGGAWEPRAQLLQFSNDHTVAGVSVDFDRAVKPDFGQW